jgi:hypothetical protein
MATTKPMIMLLMQVKAAITTFTPPLIPGTSPIIEESKVGMISAPIWHITNVQPQPIGWLTQQLNQCIFARDKGFFKRLSLKNDDDYNELKNYITGPSG